MNSKIKPSTYIWWSAVFITAAGLTNQLRNGSAFGWSIFGASTGVMLAACAFMTHRERKPRRR